jgi:hypothetical protein
MEERKEPLELRLEALSDIIGSYEHPAQQPATADSPWASFSKRPTTVDQDASNKSSFPGTP